MQFCSLQTSPRVAAFTSVFPVLADKEFGRGARSVTATSSSPLRLTARWARGRPGGWPTNFGPHPDTLLEEKVPWRLWYRQARRKPLPRIAVMAHGCVWARTRSYPVRDDLQTAPLSPPLQRKLAVWPPQPASFHSQSSSHATLPLQRAASPQHRCRAESTCPPL